MNHSNLSSFGQFVARRKADLRRISAATQGEYSPGDMESEAWLKIHEFRSKGVHLDLDNPQHESLLLSHLYQQFVRYAEVKQVRWAVRLDHSPNGEEGESHPLMNMLAASDEYDPAVALEAAEEQALAAKAEPGVHHSLAGAYLALLRMFDNRMHDVAQHLLISLSYCYLRCAHARILAVHQTPLPLTLKDKKFVPGAWRKFRLLRAPVQMVLDFEADAVQPVLVADS